MSIAPRPFVSCPLLFGQHEQIRFHEHHPEYGDYWSPDTGNDADTTPATYDKPNSERLPEQDAHDEPRILQVRRALFLVVVGVVLLQKGLVVFCGAMLFADQWIGW